MRTLLLLICLSLAAAPAVAQGTADLILVNGRIYTLDPQRPWAEAIATEGERIRAVGSTADIRKLAGPRTRTIDLRGSFALPGFNDGHVHIDQTGALLVGVNLLDVHRDAVKTAVPPHIHAIGDQGNRILLDIYERVLTEAKMIDSDHRWRVIHAQVVHHDDVQRFGRLKLVAEIDPYHVSDDMRWMEERIGKERSKGAYAFRALKEAGAVLVFGSDSPGTNAARYYLSPVYGLYAAVTRQTLSGEPKDGWFPDQRLTIEEAIDAYTRAPAWASFEERSKGTLAAGRLADLAVFDTNLIEVGKSNPSALLKAKATYTITGGTVVYEAPAATSTSPAK